MANTAGGYRPQSGGRPQFPAYAGGGQYSQHNQQQQFGFNYYAPPPPQPPAPPGVHRFSGGSQFQQQSQNTTRNTGPPPPPPGETKVPSPIKSSPANNSIQRFPLSGGSSQVPQNNGGSFAPLQPPPLPPMFPWMSQALHESMTTSQFAQSFQEEASNLPFVPVVVNDADLAKMTESVIKEAEQWNSHQLQYYKAVMNQDLPQKLKELFQPLYCKLCTLTLSSPIVAKDHYAGKRHKKGVEAWLLKNPGLSTHKQRLEAQGAASGTDFQPHGTSGSVIRCSGGGMAVTGRINGFITNRIPDPGAGNKGSFGNAEPYPSSFENGNRKRPAQVVDNQQTPAPLMNISNTQPTPNFIGPQQPSGPTGQAMPLNKDQQTSPGGPEMILRNPRANPSSSSGNSMESFDSNSGFNNPQANTFHPKRPRKDDDRFVGPGQGGTQRAAGQPSVAIGQTNKPLIPVVKGQGGGPPPKSMCELCNVQLSSKVMAKQHFDGKNHKAKLAALKEGVGNPASTSAQETPQAPAQAMPSKTDSVPIASKLLAMATQPSIQQIPPPENGIGIDFSSDVHFQPPMNPPSNGSQPRGGGGGGSRGGFNQGNRGGPGRGGGGNQFGRGGGAHQSNSNFSNNSHRGGPRGGGRGGGPPFRNNNANNNTNNANARNNFNANNPNKRFNGNTRGRGR